jgi:hypothetical protein
VAARYAQQNKRSKKKFFKKREHLSTASGLSRPLLRAAVCSQLASSGTAREIGVLAVAAAGLGTKENILDNENAVAGEL